MFPILTCPQCAACWYCFICTVFFGVNSYHGVPKEHPQHVTQVTQNLDPSTSDFQHQVDRAYGI